MTVSSCNALVVQFCYLYVCTTISMGLDRLKYAFEKPSNVFIGALPLVRMTYSQFNKSSAA
jgi:hypothetical protein